MIRPIFHSVAVPIGIALTTSVLAQNTQTSDQNTSFQNALPKIEITSTTDPKLKDCDAWLTTDNQETKCIKLSPEEKLERRVFNAAEFSPLFNCAVAARHYKALTEMTDQKSSPVIRRMTTELENHFLQDVRDTVGHKPDDIDYVGHRARFVLDGETAIFRGSIYALEYALKSKIPTKNLLESFHNTAYTAVNYCSKAILGYDFHTSFDEPQRPKVEVTGAGKNRPTSHPDSPKQEQ